MKTKSPILLVGLFCLLCLAACGRATNPDDVAIAFWEGLSENNFEQATEYSTAESQHLFDERVRNASFQIGKVKYDCDGATVNTQISRQSVAASSLFKTYLVRDPVDDEWKVDYPRTIANIDKVTDKRFTDIVATTKATGKEIKQKVQFKTFFKELWHAVVAAFKELKTRFLRTD